MIPENWQKKTIGDLCDFSSGHGFRPKDWSTKGYPIIRIQNLTGSKEFNYYDGVPREKWLVEPGTILFAWAGVKGVSFGPAIWEGPVGVLNQHIYRIHPKNSLDSFWLYSLLEIVTQHIEQRAHGFKSSLLHVRKADITEQSVLVPPIEEQSKIAEILSTWDEAIRQTEGLIAAKQQRKKGLMQRLLTGQVRFPGFEERPWREAKLGEFFEEFSTKNVNGDELTVLSCSKIYGIVPQTVVFDKRVASTDTARYKVVERGDLVYDPMLLWDASIGFVDSVDEGVISPAYNTFKFRSDSSAVKRYFQYLFKSYLFRHYYKVISQGTNVRRRKAPAEAFLGLTFPFPTSVEEQEQITSVLLTSDHEIELLQQKVAALQEQKKGLMQRLLTGQVRVKV